MLVHKFDLTSQEFKRNPFPITEKMRAAGPVIRMKLPLLGGVWVTTTYEASKRVLHDKDLFVTEPRNAGRKNVAGMQWWTPGTIRALTNNMLGKDEPDHRRLRQLVESAFLQQSIDQMRPRIAELADQQLDVLHRQSERIGGEVDFLAHFARPFPLTVIGELLGLPAKDRLKFIRWASSFTNIKSSLGLASAFWGISKVNSYLKRQIQECRKNPRPGMLSALVAVEQDGEKLSSDELLATAFLLLFAGHETTTHLLDMGVLALLQHPDQKMEFLADGSLGSSVVNEILRYGSTVEMTKPRYASQDTEFYGQQISRGDAIVPMLSCANRDPAQFVDPKKFDIHRESNHHLAFGSGIHICLGMKLARAEVEIALEKLFTRFPDLKLSVPNQQLEWSQRLGHRSMTQLPLNLGKEATAK